MILRRLQSLLLATAITFGVATPLLITHKALAAGETYTWDDQSVILVTGPDIDTTLRSTLLKSSSNLPNQEYFTGIINRKVVVPNKACTVHIALVIRLLGDANQGSLSVYKDSLTTCPQNIQSEYSGTVSIGGTRASSQANVKITVWSPKPFNDSLATLIITARQTGFSSSSGALNKTGFDTSSGQKAAYYEHTFRLKPGDYQICSNDVAILACKDLKVPNTDDMTVTYGIRPAAAQDFCDQSFGISWLVCDAISIAADAAEKIDSMVLSFLKIDTNQIFNPEGKADFTESSEAFYSAWKVMRNIAYALLVIIGLLMVISQIAGLDIFDAYTIRKMLPKIIMAVIFIGASWWLLEKAFMASNDATDAIRELIKSPFSGVKAGGAIDGGDITISAILTLILAPAAVAGGVAYLAILGLGGILSLVGTILLAVFSAFILLAARNVVAYMLIIGAPLAIACATFDPFDGLFKGWRALIIAILLSVPAVGAVIELSHVGALIAFKANSTITAIAILVSGYFLIAIVFKKLDGVAGQLGNVVSAATGKLQKGLADYRQNTAKTRYGEAMEEKHNIRGAGWAVGLGRRAKLAGEAGAGAFGIGKSGRAKYNEAVRTMRARSVAGILDHDKDRAGGDDDAMKLLAKKGMTESKFIKDYATIQQENARRKGQSLSNEDAAQRARNAIGLTQSSFGARVGTDAMRVAAQRALLKSNTSYRLGDDGKDMTFEQMNKAMYGDVSQLVRDGLVTAADAASMIKSNGARADRAGVGFGRVIGTIDQVALQGTSFLDTVDSDTGKTQIAMMADDAIQGTGPGQLVGQRHEAIRMLGPEMLRRAQEAYDKNGGTGVEFIQQAAAAAGRRDLAGQLPELNAGLMASNVESQKIDGKTMQQWEEYFRTQAPPEQQAIFQRYRREYSSAWQQPGSGDPTAKPGALPG
jgi:hypothetical protein